MKRQQVRSPLCELSAQGEDIIPISSYYGNSGKCTHLIDLFLPEASTDLLPVYNPGHGPERELHAAKARLNQENIAEVRRLAENAEADQNPPHYDAGGVLPSL